MENGRQHNVSGDDFDKGSWVVIDLGPNRGYIGKVAALDHKPVGEGELKIGALTLNAKVVTLNPCYDFFTFLRKVVITDDKGQPEMFAPGVPKTGMARDPFVTTHNFCLKPNPVHITMGPGVVLDLFSEMTEDDRLTYISFVIAARDATKKHTADKAGLKLPTDGEVRDVERSRSSS
jgi:hypothetical protein